MLKSRQPIDVQVIRGDIVESQHQVMATFWQASRGLIGYSGNIDYLTFPRSAIKMLQVIPLVESGAYEHFKLSEQMLALACASHRAEPQHLELLKKWFELTGLKESQLACGPHTPFSQVASENLIRQNQKPSRAHNNCSGKHLGFLTISLFLKENLETYHEESHPGQRRIRKVLSDLMRIDLEKSSWGIDGCGIPTFGIPIQNVARGMSHLIDAKAATKRSEAMQKIISACLRYPELLSGSDDWTALAMKQAPDKVLLKSGAEGVLCGLLPDQQISFTLKCIDGNSRAIQAVTFEVLKNYGILSDTQIQTLWKSQAGTIKNTRNEVVGEIRVLTKND